MKLNNMTEGTILFEIDWTPKGTTNRQLVYVYAKNSLDASNALILRKMWGKQHSVRIATNAHLMH